MRRSPCWVGALAVAALALSACSRALPPGETRDEPEIGRQADPQADSQPAPSSEDLLGELAVAVAQGDVERATRLAETLDGRVTTPTERSMLRLLSARIRQPAAAPTTRAQSGNPTDAWGASIVRVRRTVLDSNIDTTGYDSLPFFHGYREAASCCQYALFDLGELIVASAEASPPDDTMASDADRVIELDFGEFLRRTGVDARRTVYHGGTRVVDDRLVHRYEAVTGGSIAGVTTSETGAVKTALARLLGHMR